MIVELGLNPDEYAAGAETSAAEPAVNAAVSQIAD